jgi:hypothetical protein
MSSPWPASLDALVAAPRQHHLLLENERVRVLDTRIEPGDTTPIHTHQWPAVHYVLSWSAFVRRDAFGNVLVDTRVTSDEALGRASHAAFARERRAVAASRDQRGDKTVTLADVRISERNAKT